MTVSTHTSDYCDFLCNSYCNLFLYYCNFILFSLQIFQHRVHGAVVAEAASISMEGQLVEEGNVVGVEADGRDVVAADGAVSFLHSMVKESLTVSHRRR